MLFTSAFSLERCVLVFKVFTTACRKLRVRYRPISSVGSVNSVVFVSFGLLKKEKILFAQTNQLDQMDQFYLYQNFRVPDQKGASRLYNVLEIYHSGPEPSKCTR